MSKKYNYSIQIKVTDNNTAKDSDIFLEGDDSKNLGKSASYFIEAAIILVNLDEESLKKIKELVDEKLKKLDGESLKEIKELVDEKLKKS